MGRWNARVKGVCRDPAAVQAGGRVAGRPDAAARARRIMEPMRIARIRKNKSVTPGTSLGSELEPYRFVRTRKVSRRDFF